MYAIVTCPFCRNDRMIDLDIELTSCPFCGKKFKSNSLVVKFQHENQTIVRDVLHKKSEVPVRDSSGNTDPVKKLAYLVSVTNDPAEQITMIAKGLSEIYGEFTEEQVEMVIPGKGKKYTRIMLEECIIHEVGYGKFKV